MEFLRMSGMYWGLTALHLINNGKIPKEDEIFEYIISCEHSCGGYSPAPGHDPHLLYTLSAVQVSIIYCLITEVYLIEKTCVCYCPFKNFNENLKHIPSTVFNIKMNIP